MDSVNFPPSSGSRSTESTLPHATQNTKGVVHLVIAQPGVTYKYKDDEKKFTEPMIIGTENPKCASSAKAVYQFINSEAAVNDFANSPATKLGKVGELLINKAMESNVRAEKISSRSPTVVKNIIHKIVKFLIDAKSYLKNANGVTGIFSSKTDAKYYQEALEALESKKIIVSAKSLLKNPELMNDSREMRAILTSTTLTDVDKLNAYQKKFHECLKKYVKDEGNQEELKKLVTSKKKEDADAVNRAATPDDIFTLTLVILFSDMDTLPQLMNEINRLENNLEVIGAPTDDSDQEIIDGGVREMGVIQLCRGRDTIKLAEVNEQTEFQ